MKKLMKRFLALACVIVLAMSMTACSKEESTKKESSKSKSEDLSKVNGEELLTKASESAQKSFAGKMLLNIDMSAKETADAEPQTIKVDADIDMQFVADPLSAYIGGSASGNAVGTEFEGSAEVYFAEEDGKQLIYVGYDIGTGMVWMYMDMSGYMEGLDVNTIMDSATAQQSADVFSKIAVEAVEKVNDKDCYKVVCTMNKESLKKAMEAQDSAMDTSSLDVLSDFELPVVYYIAKDGSTLEKCTMELAEFVKNVASDAVKATGESVNVDELLTVNACSLEMIYDCENAPETITIPEDAKANAMDMSSYLAY